MPQFDFRNWIKDQSGEYKLDASDPDHLKLNTEYAAAEINFYELENEPEIAEFRIYNHKDDEVKFFLHFQTDEEAHAKSLFAEMTEVLVSLKEQQSTQILLCCSAGLTTSFFAEKLNETAKAMDLDYVFSAKDVNSVYTEGFHYDAVLVAPQVGFLLKRISSVLQDQLVMQIPTQIFGSYNAGACVEMVKNALQERKKSAEEKALEHISHDISNDKTLLIIAVMPDVNGSWIRYRLYDHGRNCLDEEVIKKTITLHDITDIIDTRRCSCNGKMDIDAIGIAIPGMIIQGRLEILGSIRRMSELDLQNGEGDGFHILDYFKQRYKIPVFINNNVNAAAIGYYGQQDHYKNIIFHSQPVGYKSGGQGIVINGNLVEGAHQSAGELRFVINHLEEVKQIANVVRTPDEMVKIVAAGIAVGCVSCDPELVCVRSCMTPDMDEIRNELKKYMPESHMPELVHITNIDEYVLLGEMILSLQSMAGKH